MVQAAGFVALLGMMSARLGARTTATLSAATLKRLQVGRGGAFIVMGAAHHHRPTTRQSVSQGLVGWSHWLDGWMVW